MVWSRSALDSAVQKYNEEFSAAQGGHSEKTAAPLPRGTLDERAEKDEPRSRPDPAPPCGEAHGASDADCPCRNSGACPNRGKQCCAAPPQSPLDRLLKDKDALLIAGVILLLMNEKADSKLILALAFVLLM